MSNPHGVREGPQKGLGFDPDLYFLELYVAFLQGWFNFLPLEHEFYCDPDINQTRVVVRGEAPVDYEAFEHRPMITVVWGPTNAQNFGIDNFVSREIVKIQEADPQTGQSELWAEEDLHTDMESGYLLAYVVGHGDLQAKRLARMVWHATRSSRKLLESEGGFHSIGRAGMAMNSPSPPGALVRGAPDNVDLTMIQVNVPIQYQLSWKIRMGRTAPQHRSVQMILQERRARDYDYPSIEELTEVHLGRPGAEDPSKLGINLRPRVIRLVRGTHSGRPTTVEVGTGIDGFQQADLSTDIEQE